MTENLDCFHIIFLTGILEAASSVKSIVKMSEDMDRDKMELEDLIA